MYTYVTMVYIGGSGQNHWQCLWAVTHHNEVAAQQKVDVEENVKVKEEVREI